MNYFSAIHPVDSKTGMPALSTDKDTRNMTAATAVGVCLSAILAANPVAPQNVDNVLAPVNRYEAIQIEPSKASVKPANGAVLWDGIDMTTVNKYG